MPYFTFEVTTKLAFDISARSREEAETLAEQTLSTIKAGLDLDTFQSCSEITNGYIVAEQYSRPLLREERGAI